MRIIVASTPKTGNIWIKSLLAEIYNLQILGNEPREVEDLSDRFQQGWFIDNSIFHQHFPPNDKFFELVDTIGCHLVTTIRNPYDVFVSLYFYVQNFPEIFSDRDRELNFIFGKPLDHPDVLFFLRGIDGGFRIHIEVAEKWVSRKQSIIIRYEDLLAKPFNVLSKVTAKIAPTSKDNILNAIEVCRAENMRKQNDDLQRHIREATVGDWRNHLTEAHLQIFRTQYGETITKLGYELA